MMSDLDQRTLRGPVRKVRTDVAEWNAENGDWWPLKTRAIESFRPDGQVIESQFPNRDGSVGHHLRVYDDSGRLIESQWRPDDVLTSRVLHTYDAHSRLASLRTVDADGSERETERYRYDENGRKTKTEILWIPESRGATCSTSSCAVHYAVEGTDFACSAPGATTSTTIYDERGLLSEVSFHDPNGALVCRVVLSRDRDGRVESERMELGSPATFFGRPAGVDVPADERESSTQLLTTVFEDQTLSVATHTYDEKGRRTESVRRMGQLSEERTTFRYDDHDNPVEQVSVDLSREMRVDDGVVKIEEKPALVQHVRFEYQYDAYGNWTERVVWARTEPNTVERRSNIERRTITYYGG